MYTQRTGARNALSAALLRTRGLAIDARSR